MSTASHAQRLKTSSSDFMLRRNRESFSEDIGDAGGDGDVDRDGRWDGDEDRDGDGR